MESLPHIIDMPNGPMAEGASPGLLTELLSNLESEIVAAGAPFREWVQPGLGRQAIAGKLAEVGLGAPEELITWFGWHNGYIPNPGPGSPFPNFSFASLEDAIYRYVDGLQVVWPAGPGEPDPAVFEMGAGRGWLRLIDNHYGLAIDCTADPAESPLLHCASEDFAFEPDLYRAVSLCTYVTWTIEGIRNGSFTWDPSVTRWSMTRDTTLYPESQARVHFW